MKEDGVKITVIVPVYNVEDYLQRCIGSLLGQSFRGFDVILIDDGSTDSSGKLCNSLALQHPFIKVLHKENGGLSDARNAAYPYITGKYVMFLDSDDFLTDNALELLYGFAEKENCQVVQGGFYYLYEQEGRLVYDNRWFERGSKPIVLGREAAMKELVKNNYIKNFAWGKLYLADIVKDLPFPKGRYFEDSFWQHLVFDRAQNVGYVPSPVLCYTQRSSSISGSFNGKSIDLLCGLEERLTFIDEKYPALSRLMKKQLVKTIGLHYSLSQKRADAGVGEIFRKYLEEARNRIGLSAKEMFLIRHGSVRNILSLPKRAYSRLFGKKPTELPYKPER